MCGGRMRQTYKPASPAVSLAYGRYPCGHAHRHRTRDSSLYLCYQESIYVTQRHMYVHIHTQIYKRCEWYRRAWRCCNSSQAGSSTARRRARASACAWTALQGCCRIWMLAASLTWIRRCCANCWSHGRCPSACLRSGVRLICRRCAASLFASPCTYPSL